MNKEQHELKTDGVLGRLFGLMAPYKGRMIFAIILIFVSVAAYSAAPLMLGEAINSLGRIFAGEIKEEVLGTFLTFLGVMVGCYLLHAVLSFVSTSIIVGVTENTIFDLRKRIDFKLSKLPLNYYDTHTYGDILSRVTNDINVISDSLQSSIYQVLNTVFTVLMLLFIMFSVNGVLTLVGLVVIPVILVIAAKIAGRSEKAFVAQQQKTGELNGYVEEYYSGHNIVTVFGREKTVGENFSEINNDLCSASTEGMFLADALSPIMQNGNNLSLALVCLVGAMMSIAGGLSVGMIQAFTQYFTQLSTAMNSVMSIVGIIQSTKAAAARVFEFLDEEEEIPDVEERKFPEPLKGKVEFDHVKFGYLPHKTLIHDLDITINPGEKTAIVGPTGAGKTTLVNLIMRFYDVKGGAIRIDGVDIREMKREDLRNIFGMVLQETWLYSGTIMENIRYGKLDATDEEVIEAAKKARADAFIRTLPGGYNFVLQEGASNIAQGQRQLLTIARAMLNNPPIMILDEATSSVDTRTEVMIQEAMAEMMKGHTSFVIAHRLSTIRDSENILYMQDGDILEVGNHDELMAKNGLYAKLYNSQFAENNGE